MNTILRDDNLELYMFYFLSINDIYNLRLINKDYNTFIINGELHKKYELLILESKSFVNHIKKKLILEKIYLTYLIK